jgi:hypothetical protein
MEVFPDVELFKTCDKGPASNEYEFNQPATAYCKFAVTLLSCLLIYCFIFEGVNKSQICRHVCGFLSSSKGHITLVPIVKFTALFPVYSYRFLHLHATKWTEFRELQTKLIPFTIDLQLISYCIKRWLNALCWSKCWCLVGYTEASLLDWKPSANFASRFNSWIMVMRDGAIFVTVMTSW